MKKVLRAQAVIIAVTFTVFYVLFANNFFIARKRSRATKIVNDARIYERAIDQWAREHEPNKAPLEANPPLPPKEEP